MGHHERAISELTESEKRDFRSHRYCKATSRQTGQPCRARPVPFSDLCVNHGGQSPTARFAAERLRLLACEPAWATLIELLDHPEAIMRYRAACAILDRGGFHIGVDLNVTRRDAREDLSTLSAEELADRARELSRQFLTAREAAIDASYVEVTAHRSDLVNIDDFDGTRDCESSGPTNREQGRK